MKDTISYIVKTFTDLDIPMQEMRIFEDSLNIEVEIDAVANYTFKNNNIIVTRDPSEETPSSWMSGEILGNYFSSYIDDAPEDVIQMALFFYKESNYDLDEAFSLFEDHFNTK